MKSRRYFWGALIGLVLSVPATAIGAFGYQLVRPLLHGQSLVSAAQLSVVFAISEAIRQAPVAVICGLLVTYALGRMRPALFIVVAGVVSASLGGIEWWWLMRASSSFSADLIGRTMALGWGATAMAAASVAVAKMRASRYPHVAVGVTQ